MKIYIETMGCPKNQNDSELAAAAMKKAGHEVVPTPEEADVLLVNTCAFINDAKEESIAKIFELAEKKDGRTLVVSGCLSQRYPKELFASLKEVDVFLGVNEYSALPAILEARKGKRSVHVGAVNSGCFDETLVRDLPEGAYTAYLRIAEGCNKNCSYCAIPSIRGPYRSREKSDILAEAKRLAKSGVKELVLIAQDVAAYGSDLHGESALPDLLRDLCKISGIHWIRLMYCYDDSITDELIDVIASEKKICKYVDIPIQHASDSILAAMNRRSTKASIMQTVQKLRERVPGIHIRTTLIVGFPGETKEDFAELLDFVKEMKFERLGAFAYSREDGTPAAKLPKQVRSDTKWKRKDAIMRAQMEISLEKNREKVGKTLEVLVEGREEDGAYTGRSAYDAPEIDNAVIFTGPDGLKPGDFVRVKVLDAFDYDVFGVKI